MCAMERSKHYRSFFLHFLYGASLSCKVKLDIWSAIVRLYNLFIKTRIQIANMEVYSKSIEVIKFEYFITTFFTLQCCLKDNDHHKTMRFSLRYHIYKNYFDADLSFLSNKLFSNL